MDKRTSMDRDKSEQLIEMVKNFPILFDLAQKDYKNNRKKDKVWEEIGIELGESENACLPVPYCPVLYDFSYKDFKIVMDKKWTENERALHESAEEVKKRWKNLRDSYAKFLRCNKTKTGQAASNNKTRLWSEQMQFFNPFLAFAKTSSNVSDLNMVHNVPVVNTAEGSRDSLEILDDFDSTIIHTEYVQDNVTEHQGTHSRVVNDNQLMHSNQLRPPSIATTASTTPTTNQTKRNRNHRSESSSSAVKDMVNYFENRRKAKATDKENYDATDYAFLAHSKIVKTFSLKRQATLKTKIAKLIIKHELLHKEEIESNISPCRSEDTIYNSQNTLENTNSSGSHFSAPRSENRSYNHNRSPFNSFNTLENANANNSRSHFSSSTSDNQSYNRSPSPFNSLNTLDNANSSQSHFSSSTYENLSYNHSRSVFNSLNRLEDANNSRSHFSSSTSDNQSYNRSPSPFHSLNTLENANSSHSQSRSENRSYYHSPPLNSPNRLKNAYKSRSNSSSSRTDN